MKIARAKPYLDKQDKEVLNHTFDSLMLADGEQIAFFEEQLINFSGEKYACVCSSGYSALALSMKGVGVKPGDVVIMPVITTCHALRNAIELVGGVPYFADTYVDNPTVDYRLIPDEIKRKAKCIIAVNHFGFIDNAIYSDVLSIPVIEDACHSFGFLNNTGNKNKVASIVSFYPTKLLTSIDGGVVLSGSKELIGRCIDLRYYRSKEDDMQRYNFKLSNLGAALGRSQLEKLPRFLKERENFAKQFLEAIKGSKIIVQGIYDKIKVFYKFPVVFKEGVDFKEIVSKINEQGVPFGTEFILQTLSIDQQCNAGSLAKRFYALPCYPALTNDEVSHICQVLNKVFK